MHCHHSARLIFLPLSLSHIKSQNESENTVTATPLCFCIAPCIRSLPVVANSSKRSFTLSFHLMSYRLKFPTGKGQKGNNWVATTMYFIIRCVYCLHHAFHRALTSRDFRKANGISNKCKACLATCITLKKRRWHLKKVFQFQNHLKVIDQNFNFFYYEVTSVCSSLCK